jgi:hypothetical protein
MGGARGMSNLNPFRTPLPDGTMPAVRASLGAVLVALVAVLGKAAPGAPPAGPVVLFDQGHGQRFLIRGKGPLDLSSFASVVRARGGKTQATKVALTPAALDGVQALVVSGPFDKVRPDEVEAIAAFVERGGRLAVMIHVEAPVADLLHKFAISVSNGVIREQAGVLGNDPLNFRVTRFGTHPLTKGLDSFAVYGAWALLPTSKDAQAIAVTGPTAWVDLNRNGKLEKGDAVQSFAVLVAGRQGNGGIVAFGDDALFQNKFLKDGNRRLAENLAEWLLGKDPRP